MAKTMLAKRLAAITLMGSIAVFGLSACGTETPNEGQSPTTSSSQEKQTNFNGTDVSVTTESDGKVSWSIYAEDGPARGTVDVEVGGWTASSDKTVDGVYPEVHTGTYNGFITYTNPEGGTIQEEFTYTLEKADPTMTIVGQTPETPTADTPITLEVKVEGNKMLTGTVTAVETVSNSTLAKATVNDEGVASLTFHPEREGGTLNVRLTYSGDQDNAEATKTQVITLR